MNMKIVRSVSINTPGTATSATNQMKTLDVPHFPAVAVPKNSATSSATAATNNLNMKGGKKRLFAKVFHKKTTTIILGGI